MNALTRFLDPKQRLRQMPAPDPRCKTYDFAGTVQLLRNHERQMQLSRDYSTAACHPYPRA